MEKERPEVTKQWLTEKVMSDPNRVIGRALVAIFRRQTEDEKTSDGTQWKNGMGFSANDARLGSLGAKAFQDQGSVPEWILKHWTKPNKHGQPKIVKYAKQLNLIANDQVQ